MKSLTGLFLFLFLATSSLVIAQDNNEQSNNDEKPQLSEADTMIGKVAFTFDCAQWGDSGLDHILEVMTRRNVQGTFFCTGKFFEVNKSGARKIANAGFEVANHSYEHDKKNSIYECNRVASIYKQVTGKTMTPYFRAPYLYDKEINWNYYAQKGWLKGYVSIITCDALPDFKYISDQQFLSNFAGYIKSGASRRIAIHQPYKYPGPGHSNGASILMHIDGYRWHLLEPMIDIAQNHGYICTTHSQAAIALKKKFTPYSKRNVPMSKIIAMAKAEQRLAPHQRDSVTVFVENSKPSPIQTSGLFPPSETKSLMDDLAKSQNVPIRVEAPVPKLNFHLEDAKPDLEKVAAAQDAFADYEPFEGKGTRGEMALTFNCVDYNPVALKTILDTLKENAVPSTFFVTEEYLKAFPGTIKTILENGHEVGALESAYSKNKTPGTVGQANSLAKLFKEKTEQELTRVYRFSRFGGVSPDEEWVSFEGDGWAKASVNLHSCDLNDKWKKTSDNMFNSYFKIYLSNTPVGENGAVNIAELPLIPGSGSLDGSVIAMHTHGYRYHLLNKMISHAREKGYTFVPQSKIKNVLEVTSSEEPVVVEEKADNDIKKGLTGPL